MVNISEEPTYGWTIINGHLVRQFNVKGDMYKDARTGTIQYRSWLDKHPSPPVKEMGLLVTLHQPAECVRGPMGHSDEAVRPRKCDRPLPAVRHRPCA